VPRIVENKTRDMFKVIEIDYLLKNDVRLTSLTYRNNVDAYILDKQK